MRNKLLAVLLLLLPSLCLAADSAYAPYPEPDAGYISDNMRLLGKQREERLERLLWQLESKTDVEIIIVTIASISDYPHADTSSIESFATELFNTYGIGNMPKNDGILLLVASKDRKVRIELGKGYGPERDADAERIMHKIIVPAFRDEHYADGIFDGTIALAEEFAGVRLGFPWLMVSSFIFGGVLLLCAISLFISGKSGWGWVVLGLAVLVLLFAVYLLISLLRHLPDSDSDTWSPGGMGGMGGGSSGGGGATGSW